MWNKLFLLALQILLFNSCKKEISEKVSTDNKEKKLNEFEVSFPKMSKNEAVKYS